MMKMHYDQFLKMEASVLVIFVLSATHKRTFQKGKINCLAHTYKSRSQEEGGYH